jgi:hypothetical protein
VLLVLLSILAVSDGGTSELLRDRPPGLTTLLAEGLMDQRGIRVLALSQGSSDVIGATGFRSHNRVALYIKLAAGSLPANSIVRASLADSNTRPLKILNVLQLEPSVKEPTIRVIVEAEADSVKVRESYTMELQNEEGQPLIVLKEMRFPRI